MWRLFPFTRIFIHPR